MKKKFIFLCILIFIAYVLFFPQYAVTSAANGLVLWYEQVLPALLPFSIVSGILIHTDYLYDITNFLYPLTRHIVPTSRTGSFVLISGFLFGFPMGSKSCAELLTSGKITKAEADVLFVITNNLSPAFISSYILCRKLGMPELVLPSYAVLYLPPLAAGNLLLRSHGRAQNTAFTYKKPASGSQITFKIVDAGIMDGFETLTRLGGYIMLFSMLSSMIQLFPFSAPVFAIAAGFTEITNGIHQIASSDLPDCTRYVLAMFFTAFGGLSGLAQTSSMIRGTGLSITYYVKFKLVLSAASAVLAWLIWQFC